MYKKRQLDDTEDIQRRDVPPFSPSKDATKIEALEWKQATGAKHSNNTDFPVKKESEKERKWGIKR